eukprot:scaffold19972_cov128-Isochrysis_galbana.AAC.4
MHPCLSAFQKRNRGLYGIWMGPLYTRSCGFAATAVTATDAKDTYIIVLIPRIMLQRWDGPGATLRRVAPVVCTG